MPIISAERKQASCGIHKSEVELVRVERILVRGGENDQSAGENGENESYKEPDGNEETDTQESLVSGTKDLREGDAGLLALKGVLKRPKDGEKYIREAVEHAKDPQDRSVS